MRPRLVLAHAIEPAASAFGRLDSRRFGKNALNAALQHLRFSTATVFIDSL
jgi:hypothetical protein